MAKKQMKLNIADRMMPYPKAVPLSSTIRLVMIRAALDTGDGLELAKQLRALKSSLEPDDPWLLLLSGLADMLDPEGNSELQLRATLRRRRAGNQHASKHAVWKRRQLAAEVAQQYEELLAAGESRRGLKKRVIGIVAERTGMRDSTIRAAETAVNKERCKARAKLLQIERLEAGLAKLEDAVAPIRGRARSVDKLVAT